MSKTRMQNGSLRMVHQRIRHRTCRRCYRLKAKDYLLLLVVTFITTVASFFITLYINSNYFIEFFDYILSSEADRTLARSYGPRMPENYQPQEFFGKSQSMSFDYYIQYDDFDFLRPETLNYNSRTYSNDIEILFRFPRKTSLTALLLIFHSCRHTAFDWFHTPERQRIIGAAIDLGYACLVFQATDKTKQCWSNNPDIYANNDVQMVFKGLEGFYQTYPQLVSLPRFTFGSSSGGIFSSIFAINHKYEIQGQILYTSIILPEILHTYVKAKNYPATGWIHMLRDVEFASEERISISKKIFSEHEIPHKTLPIEPIPLRHSTFEDRIPSISSDASNFIFYRLQQNHWMNYFNILAHNPRRKLAWQMFLFPSTPPMAKSEELLLNLRKNRDRIAELLNTAYGEHEISYERSFEAFQWLKNVYLTSKNRTNSKK